MLKAKTMSRTEDLTRVGWCKVHGGEFSPLGHYDRERLVQVGICQECDFWLELWKMRDDESVARISGQHYLIGDDNSTKRGFGGAGVVIKFYDGRVVVTNNLWHQGRIPVMWAEDLFDNAEFGE